METPKEGIVLDREGNEIYTPRGSHRQSSGSAQIRVIRGGPLLGLALILSIPVLLFFGMGILIVAVCAFTLVGILSKLLRFGRSHLR